MKNFFERYCFAILMAVVYVFLSCIGFITSGATFLPLFLVLSFVCLIAIVMLVVEVIMNDVNEEICDGKDEMFKATLEQFRVLSESVDTYSDILKKLLKIVSDETDEIAEFKQSILETSIKRLESDDRFNQSLVKAIVEQSDNVTALAKKLDKTLSTQKSTGTKEVKNDIK